MSVVSTLHLQSGGSLQNGTGNGRAGRRGDRGGGSQQAKKQQDRKGSYGRGGVTYYLEKVNGNELTIMNLKDDRGGPDPLGGCKKEG